MDWLGYILCIFLGALITIVVQWLLLVWYIQGAPTGTPASLEPPTDFHLPKNLEYMELWSDNGDCAAAVSLTLQFLFQELKYAPAPLAWLHRKLHQEIIDLLTRTTSGKLFESLAVRNVIAGDAAPRVRWAGVENVEIGTGGYLKTVDLILDIHYSGGFRLTVDAGMLLGKTACFHIEVAHLSGRARVRFSRDPYTHWSLSFLNPPHLELHVHPLQKRIAALFQAHARRALQKRHTLPNYTIRYKPFFAKIDPAQLDPAVDDPAIKLQGNLDINIIEISRLFTQLLPALKIDNRIYCTLSLDSNPWISYRQDEEYNIFTIDIVINKERSQQLGTVFKQVTNNSGDKYGKPYVIIDTIVPLSAAYKADLRRDDVIVAVDSKLVSGINQIAKIIKAINRPCFSIRIERRAKHYKVSDNDKCFKRDDIPKQDSLFVEDADDSSVFKRGKSNSFSFRKMSEVLDSAKNYSSNKELENKSNLEKRNLPEIQRSHTDDPSIKQSNSNASFSKHTDSLSFGFGLRKRRCSVENKTSSDSSNSSTPTASNPGTPLKRTDKVNREQNKTTDTLKEPNNSNQIKNSESLNSDNYEMQNNDDNCADLNDKFLYSDGSASTPKISIEKPIDQNKMKMDSGELIDLLQTRMSKILPLSDILYFHEKFSFKLNRNHRYLNLNIWGKNSNNTDDILLAYLNVPLQTVLKKCSNSKTNQIVKKFTLLSPEVNLSVSKNHPLSTHSGFEPCLCYGDVLISFYWSNEVNAADSKGSQDHRNTPQDSENDCLNEFELVEHNIVEDGPPKQKIVNDDIPWKSHDFIRTHFNRSTQCDFCRKKIWLKDAVQCRDCAMCCHKKCVSKCQSSVRCPLPLTIQQEDNASPSREFVDENIQQMPEFSMTEYISSTDDQNSTLSKQNFTQKADEGLLGRNAFSGLLGGLRRVGSAHNLSPLGPATHTARSLPPSPHHTPSRSQSPDEDSAWHALEIAAGDGIKTAADLLKPLLAAHLSSDLLLAKARDFGPRLLAHLPPEERNERISILVSEIRIGLDEENSKLNELQLSLSNKNLSSQEKAKQSRNFEECEEKIQALTALLLHCCSAMQSANKITCN